MCVRERKREGEGGREGERERGREGEREIDVGERAYAFINCSCKWYLGQSEPLCYKSLREGKENRMILSSEFYH